MPWAKGTRLVAKPTILRPLPGARIFIYLGNGVVSQDGEALRLNWDTADLLYNFKVSPAHNLKAYKLLTGETK